MSCLTTLPRQAGRRRASGIDGQTVTISISSGHVTVPNVTSQPVQQAQTTLTNPKAAGTVIAQKPPAGTQVDKGSKVTLNVSTGTPSTTTVATTTVPSTPAAAKVTVPHVTGLAPTPAIEELNTRGPRPQATYRTSSQPANHVLQQSPAAGTTLQRNSHVSVDVSSGPNPQPATSVPKVVGEDQATAANDLRNAGFKVVVLNRPVTNSTQDGKTSSTSSRTAARASHRAPR